ncbi:TRAP transporter large permease [Janibacter sp. G1551]|uniref:TRAP transporter large permease n=1 Tax=Janibacter sp. G1551 TaxID=3420440 RepID=UPI003D030A99
MTSSTAKGLERRDDFPADPVGVPDAPPHPVVEDEQVATLASHEDDEQTDDGPKRAWPWRVGCYGLILVLLWMITGTDSTMVIGLSATGLMLVMLGMKFPIALTMLIPSMVALVYIYDWETTTVLVGEMAYEDVASWSLSVVPMFVFMGMLLWRSGITTELFYAMRIAFNRVPASLAVGTNAAGGGLAAVSGSTVGVTYALARIGIPEMLRAGYDKRLAVGSVLVAGLSGQLIPPSILLVIFAGLASVPVGPQLMAGIGPGVFLVLAHAVALIALAVVRPQLVGGKKLAKEKQTEVARIPRAEKVKAILAIWPVPLIMAVVLGGMFSGVMTETEAGAAGALMALILAVFRHGKASIEQIKVATVEAVTASAAVFFLLMGAGLFSLVMADSGIAEGLAEWVTASGFSRVQFLLIILAAYLLLGMIGETLVAMMLTVPILMPLFPALGIDPLWFGVFAVLCVELGMILPPVGILVYIVHGIARDKEVNLGQTITLKDSFIGVLSLLPISLFVIAVMIAFPGLATWIPHNM